MTTKRVICYACNGRGYFWKKDVFEKSYKSTCSICYGCGYTLEDIFPELPEKGDTR